MDLVDQLKANWPTYTTILSIVIVAIIEAVQEAVPGLNRVAGWWHFVPFALLVLAGVSWFIGQLRPRGASQALALRRSVASASASSLMPSISALVGAEPNINFDARRWFQTAYYSPLTAEVESNIKILAKQNSPGDVEEFYARFIGVGAVGYAHDITWSYIFRSQIGLLTELNRKGLIAVQEANPFYDRAAAAQPQFYRSYSFAQWLQYLKGDFLIVQYPSDMLEITHRGKDFLKYIAHWGFDVESKVF